MPQSTELHGLLFKPGLYRASGITIEHTIPAIEAVVGGHFDVFELTRTTCAVVDEEAMTKGKPFNRFPSVVYGQLLGSTAMFYGLVLLLGLKDGDFCSWPDLLPGGSPPPVIDLRSTDG